jgi:hypothetical protein
MARIRSIKPEFWKSESIACHDFFTRLVFIGLWTYVDDNGVGMDNPKLITAELFPLEDDYAKVSRDLRESLARLADTGRIRRYTVDGKGYLSIVNWSEHQKIDRPGKPRYPQADDPRATPTPPPTSNNKPPSRVLDEPSRDPSETLAASHLPDQGAGDQGAGDQGAGDQGTPPVALAPLDAPDEVIDAEIVDTPPPLFAVPDPAPSTDLATIQPLNAGQINRQWIDFCTQAGVKLPNRTIKRYGAAIKTALDQHFTPELIKRALADMLRDSVVARPSLFDHYLVRAQTGPEKPPARMTRTEAAIVRGAPPGMTPGDLVRDALTRPA